IEKSLADAPEHIQNLKSQIMANRYKFLTFNALESGGDRKQSLMAARFLGIALKNQPTLLTNKVIWIVILKIFIGLVLPPQSSQILIGYMKGLKPQ
ncbi:MAG: glycosyl transferase family A, partial [Planktothrix sp.]